MHFNISLLYALSRCLQQVPLKPNETAAKRVLRLKRRLMTSIKAFALIVNRTRREAALVFQVLMLQAEMIFIAFATMTLKWGLSRLV
jgi:hypothetical protein